jgi:hypothetical protein
MGHAISRSKPSIVASERFARAPSIDVFCRKAGIAAIAATQLPVNRQKRRISLIDGVYLCRKRLAQGNGREQAITLTTGIDHWAFWPNRE